MDNDNNCDLPYLYPMISLKHYMQHEPMKECVLAILNYWHYLTLIR